jgi:hypothetical protein
MIALYGADNRKNQRVILAFIVTLPRRHRRAKFTMPREGVSVRARLH